MRAVLLSALGWMILCFSPANADAQANLVVTSPDPLELGRVRSSTSSAPTNVVLTNQGDADATGISAVLSDTTHFSLGAFPSTIAAAASGDFPVSCTPATPGDRTATLTVGYSGGADVVVDVHCYTPTIWIDSADPRDLGSVAVGGAAGVETFSIVNDDVVSRDVTGFGETGSQCGDYTVTSPVGSTPVAAGGSLEVTVSFEPSARGTRSCTITVLDSDAGVPDNTVALTGSGAAGELQVSGGPLTFANRRVGSGPSVVQTFTISNGGELALSIDDVSIAADDDDEDWVVENVNLSLGAGGATTVDVQFSPSGFATGYGAQDAVVTVTSDDPVDPDETVDVNGTGTAGLLDYPDGTEAYGAVAVVSPAAPSDRVVRLQNAGEHDITVSAASFGGADPGIFSIVGGFSSFTVDAGTISSALTVRCAPTISTLGDRTATLTLTSDADDGASQTVDLTCTGQRPFIQVSSVAAIDFGPVRRGTTSGSITRTVANQDLANASLLTIASVTDDSARYATSPPGDLTLTPGQTPEDFSVTFSPTADGLVEATLTIASDDPVSPSITIDLTGTGVSPEITVVEPSPLELDFGNVVVATTSGALAVTVENTSDSSSTSASLTVAGSVIGELAGESNFQIASSPTDLVLTQNETATWTVACDPEDTSPAQKTATFRITHDDPDQASPIDIPITCTSIDTALVVSPAPVAFGDVNLCDSTDVEVTFTNALSTSLDVTDITLAPAAVSQVAGTTSFTLGPAGSGTDGTTRTFRFAPVTVGAIASGTLTVTHDGSGSPSVTSLTGTGTTTLMDATPSSHDFGDVRLDETFPTQDVVLSNTGTGTFTVTSSALDTGVDFSRVVLSASPAGCGDDLPCAIGPGEDVTFRVTASPTSVGAKTDTLEIATDIPGGGDCGPVLAQIPLSADGVAPDVDVTPSSVAFGDRDVQASATTLPVTVSNTGGVPLEVSAIELSGTDAARFELVADAPPFEIPVDGSAVIDVTYTPGVAGQPHAANLRIVTDAVGALEIDVPLTGRGIDRMIGVNPSAVTFAPTYRNPSTPARRSITISNDGEAPLAITMVTRTGGDAEAFSLVGEEPTVVAGLSDEVVDVAFTPGSAGQFAADLVVTSDDSEQPMVVVPLEGMGLVPSFTPEEADCSITVPVGVPTRMDASSDCSEGIRFTNMEPVALDVSAVRVVDDEGVEVPAELVRVVDFQVSEVDPGEIVAIDLEITAERRDELDVVVELFVEDDPERIAFVTLDISAIEVRKPDDGGLGCTAAGGDSALSALLVLVLAVVLRRRPGRSARRAGDHA